MEQFPENFNEETFDHDIDKQNTEWSRAQKEMCNKSRKQIYDAINTQFQSGSKDLVFEFPDELHRNHRAKILMELYKRFSSKKFYYWCVIEYADVEEWRTLPISLDTNEDKIHISWKYKIQL